MVKKLNIILTIVMFSIFLGGLFNQQENAKALSTEEFLIKTDAFTDREINRCNDWEKTSDQQLIQRCEELLLSSWITYCKTPVYHDKLDFCKNGKLEDYLKKHDRL
jgi:hypothetical protein